MEWTRPYYGVTHLESVTWPRRATVTDYGSFAEAGLYSNSRSPLTGKLINKDYIVCQKTFYGRYCLTRAKNWLEKMVGRVV